MIEIPSELPCKNCPAQGSAVHISQCIELGACWLNNGRHPLDDILDMANISYFQLSEWINPMPTCFEISGDGIEDIIKDKKLRLYTDREIVDIKPCEQYGPIHSNAILICKMVENEIDRRKKDRLRMFGLKE